MIPVSVLEVDGDHLFNLPGSSIENVPLENPSGKLRVGFIEIGCKPRGKSRQLKDKRTLFQEFWHSGYAERYGIPCPPLYRTRVHFLKGQSHPNYRSHELDANVRYFATPPNLLESITEAECERILKKVRKPLARKELESILTSADGERLHDLIVGNGFNQVYADLRGVMAEVLALHDIRRCAPEGMSVHGPENLDLVNERFQNGTEVDGVILFYDPQLYLNLLSSLAGLEHLSVRPNVKRLSEYN